LRLLLEPAVKHQQRVEELAFAHNRKDDDRQAQRSEKLPSGKGIARLAKFGGLSIPPSLELIG